MSKRVELTPKQNFRLLPERSDLKLPQTRWPGVSLPTQPETLPGKRMGGPDQLSPPPSVPTARPESGIDDPAAPAKVKPNRTSKPVPADLLAMAILDTAQVLQLVSMGRSTLYKYMAEHRFPKSLNAGDRMARWRSSDIRDYLNCISEGRKWSQKSE